MRTSRLLLLLALLLVVAGVALFPLRLAVAFSGLEQKGLMARSVSGTIWNGRLEDARLGPVFIGDATARLAFLPLLVGTASLRLERAGEPPLAGQIELRRAGFAARDVNGEVTATAGGLQALVLPSVVLEDVGFRFERGGCTEAQGRVGLSVPLLAATPALSGDLRCSDGQLVSRLAAPSGNPRAVLAVLPDGRYRIDLAVQAPSRTMELGLLASGFRPQNGQLVRRFEGRF